MLTSKSGSSSALSGQSELVLTNNLGSRWTTYLETSNPCSLTRTLSTSILSVLRSKTGNHGKTSSLLLENHLERNSPRSWCRQ
jgi:hypothetical protein